MRQLPSFWIGAGRAKNCSAVVAQASEAVKAAENILLCALKTEYPLGSKVRVVHYRGNFSAVVVGWDKYGVRVLVENSATGKQSKWWAAHVELVKDHGGGE